MTSRSPRWVNLGLESIPILIKEFETEDTALDYAIHSQRDRRNLTDAEIARCILTLDERRKAGRPSKELAQSCANLEGKSCEQTARAVGISQRKVEQTRTIFDHADEGTKEEVLENRKSINRAYKETQQRETS